MKNKILYLLFRMLAGLLGIIGLIMVIDTVLHFNVRETASIGSITGISCLSIVFLFYAITGKTLKGYSQNIGFKTSK